MRYVCYALLSMLLLGCSSSKNAFSKFHFTQEQERSANSIQSSKIQLKNKIDGVVSAIYLNEVYPDIYNEYEYFYIYLYTKDKKEMYDPNSLKDFELQVRLNNQLPVKVKELPAKNNFSNLTNITSSWNRYYLVAFPKATKQLNLSLKNANASSATLKYFKE